MIQKIILDNRIRIENPVLLEELKRAFTIINPIFKQACIRKQLKPHNWPKEHIVVPYREGNAWRFKRILRYETYVKKEGNYFTFPRGSLFVIKRLYRKHRVKYKVIDKRTLKQKIPVWFKGKLDPERDQNRIKQFTYSHGIFKAPTGSGKTVMFLWLVAKIKQPAIILVDTERLMDQWIKEINTFLGIDVDEIGIIGGGKEIYKPITVALIQSLHSRLHVLGFYGLMGVDECPSVATETYGKCVDNFKGKYVIGLSATPNRKDGKTAVMKWYLGDIKVKIRYADAKRTPGKVFFIPTDYKSKIPFAKSNAKAIGEMVLDQKRNDLILEVMEINKAFPGAHITLSHRVGHMQELIEKLPKSMKAKAVILHGGTPKSERPAIIEGIKTGEYKYLFATHKMLGRGFDEGSLSTMYLVTPFKDPDALKQYIGRVSRLHPGKEYFQIFDFFDRYYNDVRYHASARSKLYQKLKIEKNTWRR